jgi:hypothetical protein
LTFGAARIVFVFFQTFCRQDTPKSILYVARERATTKGSKKLVRAQQKSKTKKRTGHLLSLNTEK